MTSLLGVVRSETGLKLSTRDCNKRLLFSLVLSYSLSNYSRKVKLLILADKVLITHLYALRTTEAL